MNTLTDKELTFSGREGYDTPVTVNARRLKLRNLKMRIECLHADTCLPDYWGGHHLPHVSFPVWRDMTLQEIKTQLRNEVALDAIAGNIPDGMACDSHPWMLSDKGRQEFYRAIDSIEGKDGKTEGFFSDVELPEDDGDDAPLVCAFFVFRPVE